MPPIKQNDQRLASKKSWTSRACETSSITVDSA
jgi:hypothetical protein